MVATVGLHATKSVTLAVIRQSAAGEQVTKGEALAVYNKPSLTIQANMARAMAVYREPAQIHATMGKVLAVSLGRIAHPAISPWAFRLDGHSFIVFQTQDQTLVYDRAMENWMVWGSVDTPLWNAQIGQNWLANVAGVTVPLGGNFNTGNIVCGDGASNALYFLDPDLNEDFSPTGQAGQAFQRVITGQLTHRGNEWVSLDEVQVLASDGEMVVASDLSVLLSYSDDRGHNYQNCETINVTIGDYSAQLQWSSLGSYTQPGRLLRLTDYGALKRVDDWATPDNDS